MASELFNLPFVADPESIQRGENSLAFRNLLRGEVTFSLTSGESAAKFLRVDPIPRHPKVKEAGLKETPLWFYCLAEAEANKGKLGPVGGRIVGRTILRILRRDKESYIRRGWKPSLGKGRNFTMADLVKFVRS